MPENLKRCIRSVKGKNPYAVCISTIYKKYPSYIDKKSGRKIFTGPRGGKFYLRRGEKVYV